MDSMLWYVFSFTDHRWHQNVVTTKKWHMRYSQVCHWCSHHNLTPSVIYHWADPQQWGIFDFCNQEENFVSDEIIWASVLPQIKDRNQLKCMFNSAYYITHDRNLKLTIYSLKWKQSCYLLNFVRVMLRFGNFSLNCSFRSFFSSEGFAYATMDTWKAYSFDIYIFPSFFYRKILCHFSFMIFGETLVW